MGILLDLPVVSPEPVTAQVINTSLDGCRPIIIISPIIDSSF
jgi:hypothetical protein